MFPEGFNAQTLRRQISYGVVRPNPSNLCMVRARISRTFPNVRPTLNRNQVCNGPDFCCCGPGHVVRRMLQMSPAKSARPMPFWRARARFFTRRRCWCPRWGTTNLIALSHRSRIPGLGARLRSGPSILCRRLHCLHRCRSGSRSPAGVRALAAR